MYNKCYENLHGFMFLSGISFFMLPLKKCKNDLHMMPKSLFSKDRTKCNKMLNFSYFVSA